MYFVAFDVDGGEGTGRTEVLAGTTADTLGFVYGRDVGSEFVIRIQRHHLDGAGGTMAGTVAAFYSVGDGDTVLLDPDGVAKLDA